MLILTVVAVRLIGLWLIAAHIGGVVALAAAALNLSQAETMEELESAPMVAVAVAATLPVVAGTILILLSVSLSRLIVPEKAHELPAPTAVSSRTVTQIGVFLIGLMLAGTSLPIVVALGLENLGTTVRYWVQLGVGVLFMLGSGLFAGFVAKLRGWP
jgi:hypothetical protein